MSKIRRILGPVAVTWLLLHVSVASGLTTVLLAAGASESDLVCTCGHGADHGLCPMHHKPAGDARCRMQGTQSELGTVLISLLGPITPPFSAGDIVTVDSRALPKGYDTAWPVDWTAPPDAPPPRG